MKKEKVAKLFSDKEFLKKLFKLKTENEINELFLSQGVELTPEELEEIFDVVEACSGGFFVLPDSSLDDVVGGVQQQPTGMMDIFQQNYDVINEVIKEINGDN